MARERWASRLGVVAAVAGSAIGLGNFLRFPGQAVEHGGGAFMIPYFVAFFLLGLPLIWIEWSIGRFGGGFGHSTAPGMFHSMCDKNRFIKYFGVIGIFGPTIIFIYYTYIESWLLGYSIMALVGKYNDCTTPDSMKQFLLSYVGVAPDGHFRNMVAVYVFFLVTFGANFIILYWGIQKGIERVCKLALPMLVVMGVLLMVHVFSLGASDPAQPENTPLNGLGYLWNPRWSELADARVWLAAAGQIFYTLSVGMGIILTYASYLRRNNDVALSGLTAASANEVAEVILGGSIVIPAAFAIFGAETTRAMAHGGTFNLGFYAMPAALLQMPWSELSGFLWFGLLFLAGITSSTSLAQPAIAFLEDEFDLSKKQAVALLAAVTFVAAQPVIFFFGNGVLDEMDFWAVNVCLVGCALVEVILFGWVFGMDRAWTELHVGSDITIPRFYRIIIKYITPIILMTILGAWLVQDGIDAILMKRVSAADYPYIVGTRLALAGGLVILIGLVSWSWRRRARRDGAGQEPIAREGGA